MSIRKLGIVGLCTVLLGTAACSSSEGEDGTLDLGLEPSFGTRNDDLARQMYETPPEEDGPFWMVNLIQYRDQAVYADGRETDLTGREADALYTPIEFLEAIGAEVAFTAEVDENLVSLDGQEWDEVAIVRYPSRAKFFEMVLDEEFQERSIHKDAGVERSQVIVTQLQEPMTFPQPDVIPNPSTPTDPPVAVTHLLAYRDIAEYPADINEPERTGEEAVTLYRTAASPVTLEQGGGPVARFEVVGVYIGDGREWDEFRINAFPSRAAFQAVLDDPDRQAAQFHREAAIEDTYALANTVQINTFTGTALDGGGGGGEPPEMTDNGTGRLCTGDADCSGQEADMCLGDGAGGFCTVEGCGAGDCEGNYVCCRDCADFAADLLPFDGSACVPATLASELVGPPECTCD
ncbi:MAG: hypothetical protein AAF997_06135 [Myxococcota bacterium]